MHGAGFRDCVETMGAVDKCIRGKYIKMTGNVGKGPKRVDNPKRKCYTPSCNSINCESIEAR